MHWIQSSTASAETALFLIVFLFLHQLYPYEPEMFVSSEAIILDNFCSLLKEHFDCHSQATLRHVVCSLKCIISVKVNNQVEAQKIIQFIVNILDINLFLLRHFNTLLNLYWNIRILMRLNHDKALCTLSATLSFFKPSGLLTSDCDDVSFATIEYECTSENCNKVFDMKNVWNQHKNSQHFQAERWWCHQFNDSSNIKQCTNLSWHWANFQQYLKNKHDIVDEDYHEKKLNACHLDTNRSLWFWCSFCQVTMSLFKKELKTWDERFNHIKSHYRSEQNIKNWISVDKHLLRRKQEVLNAKSVLDIQDDSSEVRKLKSSLL